MWDSVLEMKSARCLMTERGPPARLWPKLCACSSENRAPEATRSRMSKQPTLTSAQDDQIALAHARKRFPTSAVGVSRWNTAARRGAACYNARGINNVYNAQQQCTRSTADPGSKYWHHGGPRHHFSPFGQKPFSYENFSGLLRDLF